MTRITKIEDMEVGMVIDFGPQDAARGCPPGIWRHALIESVGPTIKAEGPLPPRTTWAEYNRPIFRRDRDGNIERNGEFGRITQRELNQVGGYKVVGRI